MPKIITQNSIIEKFISIFGDRFDYSEVKYIHAHSNIAVICKIHGKFNNEVKKTRRKNSSNKNKESPYKLGQLSFY